MKILKTAASIAFALGFLLILGAAGESDIMHTMNWIHIVVGIALMLPLPIVSNMKFEERK